MMQRLHSPDLAGIDQAPTLLTPDIAGGQRINRLSMGKVLSMAGVAFALFAANANALTKSRTKLIPGGSISSLVHYNPHTGASLCHVDIHDSNTSFSGLTILEDIQQKFPDAEGALSWQAINVFAQPYRAGVVDPNDSHHASATIRHRYGRARLAASAQNHPTRINCYADNHNFPLRLPAARLKNAKPEN